MCVLPMKIMIPPRNSDKYTPGISGTKKRRKFIETFVISRKIVMKGPTIRFVITRVCYIWDLFYRGNFYQVSAESKGSDTFWLYWKINYS